jgi:hypothetical protein
MTTLDEIIAKQLAEATALEEAKKAAPLKDKVSPEAVGKADEVDTEPTKKKELTNESTNEEILSEAVSRKDFKLAASTIAQIEDKDKRQEAANLHAKIFAQGNPRFDHSRFHDACGTSAPKNEDITVSTQVATLLETEGLSEEFKTQAVTIFEAAVTDRVLQIEEGLKTKFDEQLAEATAQLDNDIDGFLNEAIQQWMQENTVAIESNFKLQLAESFMDGMQALMGKHNIELPDGKENALEVALGEVDSLTESLTTKETEKLALVEQINVMKAEKILESFKEKMTQTEFDRFVQLTESVKFADEVQYEKQLTVVLENFGNQKVEIKEAAKTEAEAITEDVADQKPVATTVNRYAEFISKNR